MAAHLPIEATMLLLPRNTPTGRRKLEKVPPRMRQPHRSAAAQGNEARANDLRKEGLEFSKRAQLEQFRADKNQWLSQWWPSLARD